MNALRCHTDNNMPVTFESSPRSLKELKDEIRGSIWVGSEAENLIKPHDLMFLEALGEIQKDVPEEQEVNCDVVEFCKTFHKCGCSVIPQPPGVVHRVYVIQKRAGEYDWANSVPIWQREFGEVEAWSRKLRPYAFGDKRRDLHLPFGFEKADKRFDSKHGRARNGIYAIQDHNVYVAPWIQSDEAIVLEWKGIKPTTRWSDSDLVDGSPEFKAAVKLFVQYAHERDFGTDPEQRSALHENWIEARSELMLRRREETRIKHQEDQYHRQHHKSFLEKLLQLKPLSLKRHSEDENDILVFAHIGNNGVNNLNAVAVAEKVKQLRPRAVLSSGGNTCSEIGSSLIPAGATYDDGGRYYLRGTDPFNDTVSTILSISGTYQITMGPNEYVAYDESRNTSYAGTTVFTYPGGAGDLGLYLTMLGTRPPNSLVTATLQQVGVANLPYDLTIGRNFHHYISPYLGAYGDGGDENKFWPTPDANDWLDALAAFKAFFLELPNNQRYYDVCYGPVHFFFVDSSADPDGNAASSVQADWLRLELLVSTARWKVVVLSDPPYSSDSQQKAALQWPFAAWGANLVIAGEAQNYERLSVGGITYIVNGLGGLGLDTSVTPITASEFSYYANYGFGRISVNKRSLRYDCIAIDGTLVDSITLGEPLDV